MNKILIVYFSKKGENVVNGQIVNLKVGNTQVVAKVIQKITGGDIFEIETEKDYPTHFHETTIRAKEELNQAIYPKLKNHLDHFKDYDTVFIGYPNWWGTYPQAIATFLKEEAPFHQMILPFCTHEGSGLGHSECDLKKACPNCEIKEGLSLRGSQVLHAKLMIEQWIEKQLYTF